MQTRAMSCCSRITLGFPLLLLLLQLASDVSVGAPAVDALAATAKGVVDIAKSNPIKENERVPTAVDDKQNDLIQGSEKPTKNQEVDPHSTAAAVTAVKVLSRRRIGFTGVTRSDSPGVTGGLSLGQPAVSASPASSKAKTTDADSAAKRVISSVVRTVRSAGGSGDGAASGVSKGSNEGGSSNSGAADTDSFSGDGDATNNDAAGTVIDDSAKSGSDDFRRRVKGGLSRARYPTATPVLANQRRGQRRQSQQRPSLSQEASSVTRRPPWLVTLCPDAQACGLFSQAYPSHGRTVLKASNVPLATTGGAAGAAADSGSGSQTPAAAAGDGRGQNQGDNGQPTKRRHTYVLNGSAWAAPLRRLLYSASGRPSRSLANQAVSAAELVLVPDAHIADGVGANVVAGGDVRRSVRLVRGMLWHGVPSALVMVTPFPRWRPHYYVDVNEDITKNSGGDNIDVSGADVDETYPPADGAERQAASPWTGSARLRGGTPGQLEAVLPNGVAAEVTGSIFAVPSVVGWLNAGARPWEAVRAQRGVTQAAGWPLPTILAASPYCWICDEQAADKRSSVPLSYLQSEPNVSPPLVAPLRLESATLRSGEPMFAEQPTGLGTEQPLLASVAAASADPGLPIVTGHHIFPEGFTISQPLPQYQSRLPQVQLLGDSSMMVQPESYAAEDWTPYQTLVSHPTASWPVLIPRGTNGFATTEFAGSLGAQSGKLPAASELYKWFPRLPLRSASLKQQATFALDTNSHDAGVQLVSENDS